jgi:hypothetical protein
LQLTADNFFGTRYPQFLPQQCWQQQFSHAPMLQIEMQEDSQPQKHWKI